MRQSIYAVHLGHRVGRHQAVRVSLDALEQNEHCLELAGRHGWSALERQSLLVTSFSESSRAGEMRLDV